MRLKLKEQVVNAMKSYVNLNNNMHITGLYEVNDKTTGLNRVVIRSSMFNYVIDKLDREYKVSAIINSSLLGNMIRTKDHTSLILVLGRVSSVVKVVELINKSIVNSVAIKMDDSLVVSFKELIGIRHD